MHMNGLLEHYPLGGCGTRRGVHSGLDLLPVGHVGCEVLLGGYADYFGGGRLLGAPGKALSFGPAGLTLSAWLLLEELPPDSYQMVAAKDDGDQHREYSLFFHTGSLRCSFNLFYGATVVGTASSDPGSIEAGRWLHLLAWYDAANVTVGIRVNGGTPVEQPVTQAPAAQDTPFSLGAGAHGASPLNGHLKSVSVYGRPLSAAEQDELYNGGEPLPQ